MDEPRRRMAAPGLAARSAAAAQFRGAQLRGQPRRMNARAPQAFVGVDISHAAKDALVQQQGFDPGAAAAPAAGGTPRRRLPADPRPARPRSSAIPVVRQEQHLAEAANVGVAQLAAVVELEKYVGVGRRRLAGCAHLQPAGHAQMHDQARAARSGVVAGAARREPQGE